jgi:hypothetical protein
MDMMSHRDAYIPARLSELLQALRNEGRLGGEQDAFEEVVRLIAALFHYESFAALEQLKALYFPLDPDRPGAAGAPADQAAFEAALEKILLAGNFEETPFADLGRKAQADVLNDLRLKTSDVGIRRVRYFARGSHSATFEKPRLLGLGHRAIEAEVLDDVVLVVAFQDLAELSPALRRKLSAQRLGVRPGAVMVKHFRGVARHELAALHPGARPTMKRSDQLMLGVPALAGGVPILLQIGPAITVIFAALAAYFGAKGVIDNDQLKKAVAAASGLVALGAFVMRQWMKYERQSLRYQKRLADTVYFRNAANNAGVLYGLIAAAEEQDVKEAALAYHALLAQGAMTKEALDDRIEAFLRERVSFDVDFEIQDALGKLQRLKLVEAEGETLRAAAPKDALSRLDEAWDGIFNYAAKATA